MTIFIAICDDEYEVTNHIEDILREYEKDKRLEFHILIFHEGNEVLKWNGNFDIIFLDIYMKGIDGIETARLLRKKDKLVEIIFLTSHVGLTKEALAVHAYEYLEKPITKEVIFKQLDDVIEKISHSKLADDFRMKTVDFNSGKSEIRFQIDDIYYFERVDRKIKAITKKGTFILNETISSLEEKLQAFDFVTPHQSFVVNINNMKDYIKDEIVMTNYDVIPVAQKRSSEFKRRTREFLQKKLENS